jgi:hypothetical protein
MFGAIFFPLAYLTRLCVGLLDMDYGLTGSCLRLGRTWRVFLLAVGWILGLLAAV